MNVRAIQAKLKEKGYLIKVDNILGGETRGAIMDFQAKQGIKSDGEVGPNTLKALGLPAFQQKSVYKLRPISAAGQTLAARAMYIAISQNGVREQSNNSGPAVDAFLASVGLPSGYSWCMAFVYWCYTQAANALGIINPLVRTGGCMRQWNESKCHKLHDTPAPGDVFIMDLGGGAGHTGIVTAVHGDEIETVEGNTNDNGSANGDGVYLRRRKMSRIKGYIRC